MQRPATANRVVATTPLTVKGVQKKIIRETIAAKSKELQSYVGKFTGLLTQAKLDLHCIHVRQAGDGSTLFRATR